MGARAPRTQVWDARALPRFRGDVATVIAAADVLVHPARYEAYGLGVHEAICRGVPAIVTAVGRRSPNGIPIGTRDLLIDGRDRCRAAVARRCVAGGPTPTRGCRAASRLPRRCAHRSWDAMAAEIAALVEAVAA